MKEIGRNRTCDRRVSRQIAYPLRQTDFKSSLLTLLYRKKYKTGEKKIQAMNDIGRNRTYDLQMGRQTLNH